MTLFVIPIEPENTEYQEHLITLPEELPPCWEHLAACRRFGFDTEFVGEDTYHPQLCLIQVATPEKLILIDPLTAGPLDHFWNLVTDPAYQVVVHAGREEIRLCRLWSGKDPGNLFDLQIAAGLVGLPYPLSHGNLVNQLLQIQLAKGETLTEWRERPLTASQIRYAFDDVRYLLALWQRLDSRLKALNRDQWAAEEFVRLAVNAFPEEVQLEKWRKLKGLGSLDRRRLAVVRALYRWRDAAAAETNRPTRAICRDDLLIEIAKRLPSRERDLKIIRGLPRRFAPGILNVVEQNRALPLEECPPAWDREPDSSQVGLITNVLSAVLGDYCVRNHLAPNLVASGADIKLLVRAKLQGKPFSSESLLNQGWRRAHVLPELLAVLEGRASLRIADVRSESPFAITDNKDDH
ncbi:MAG TPA: HRDC domain-containing protein [Gemmataceae bacterium]|nr:HRDC domain-containing protein [Gemmataceae bacterium]